MKNYIVRSYRAYPHDMVSISGVVEDVESCHIEPFHSMNELHALLVYSVGSDQLELPDITIQKRLIEESIAVVV